MIYAGDTKFFLSRLTGVTLVNAAMARSWTVSYSDVMYRGICEGKSGDYLLLPVRGFSLFGSRVLVERCSCTIHVPGPPRELP